MSDFVNTNADEIASIYVEACLDLRKLNQELMDLQNQRYQLKVEVEDQSLTDLNKHLDSKVRHLKEVNSFFEYNPITPRVDDKALTELNERLSETKNFLEGLQNRQISLKVNLDVQDLKDQIKKAVKDVTADLEVNGSGIQGSESAVKEFEKSLDNIGKSLRNVATAPFKGISNGFFEGIGGSFGRNIGKGVQQALEQEFKINFKQVGQNTANYVTQNVVRKINQPSTPLQTETVVNQQSQQPLAIPNLQKIGRELELIPAVKLEQTNQTLKAKQAEIKENSQKLARAIADKFESPIEEAFKQIKSITQQKTPDINQAKQKFAEIKVRFGDAYKSFNKALNEGNIDLAKAYADTIVKMSSHAAKEIDGIKANLKASGANTKFGSELSTYAGSAKGVITRSYVNPVKRSLVQLEGLEKSVDQTKKIGVNVVEGLVSGLKDNKAVNQQASKIALELLNTTRKDLGIFSPSRKFKQIGLYIGQGLVIGIQNSTKSVTEASKQLYKSAIAPFSNTVNNVRNKFVLKRNNPQNSQVTTPSGQDDFGSEAYFTDMYKKFGQRFKKKALKGIDDTEASALQGEIFGTAFSAAAMFAPQATASLGMLPGLIPATPLLLAGAGLNNLISPLVGKIKEALEQTSPMIKRFDFIGGSPEGGEREMNYARGVAGKYSISAQPALENYTKLSVAARGTKLEGEGIKDLYEGISASIKALNLGTYDSQLIFNAYTQILSKGKVSMEELRQQLGEKFPPAMNVFAKALGVSVPQLTELSSKGALLSEDVLPKVAKVLKTDFGAAAESAAGGFTSAISRMENAGFDLNIKLTKSFDGLFGGVTNLAAGMFETFNKNFDNIAKVGAAFLIGFTAQIAVATQTIMQAPAIASKMGMVQNLFIASFKKSILTLTPFFVGVFSDIADDFLGAKHSVMENMFQGVGNMFVSLFTGIDQQFRDAFDKSLFTPSFGKEKKSLFEDIKDAVMGLFRILPPGLVEMGALLVMFEQSAVLGKMLLTPMFNNLGNAVKGVSGAFTNAFRDGNTLKQSLRTLIADSSMAKGAMIALGVAAKAALALAVIAFARSDFSNPIEAAFNKTKGAMASSIDEIKTALEGLKQKSVEVGNTIKDSIKLPSKGLELNPLVWLGLSESNYRSDDFIRDVNDTNKPNNTNKVLFESSVAATATTLKTFTPFLNPIFDRVKSNSEKDVTNKKKKADEMGVGSFFTGEEQILTLGQNQLFNQASDLSRQAKELKQQLANLNLSSDTIGNFISGDVKASLDGLRKIDSEIESLGEKRSKLALADDSESKKQVKVLDDQINNLIKQRKDKQKPLTAVLGGVDDIKEQLAEQEKAINDSSLPKTAKKALLAILEPQKQMIDESVNYLKQKGLYQALEPLADVWLKVVERLKDAEKAFDKLKKTSRVDNLNKQAAIYSSNDTEANKKRNLDLLQIKELTTNKERLSMMLNLRQTSLNKLLTIPNVEQNKEKKEEISKLRENVDKDREELANTNLQIAQAKNTLLNSLREQTKQVAEYYQNIVKQVKESKIEFQKQLNQLNTMKAQNKIKAALTDVGDNIFTQFADSLVQNLQELNDIKQTKLDVQSRIQGLDFQIDDVKKQAFELKRSLPGNAKGFDSDAVKDLNRELTNTQDISEIINDNTKELDNLLQQNINNSSDLDKQFRELTNTTEDTSKSIENLDKSSNDWKGSLTSIVSVTGDVNKGFEGIGSNIANIAGQTATWIGQLMTGQGLMQGLNSGVATIMNPETQKQNPVIGNTFNTLKNFFGGDAIKREGYKIVESVGSRIENVNSFDDLAKHHPSSGREHGRNYETINGQLEEIRKTSDGRTLIKKDFVLMDSKGNQNVAIPAPASGYVKASSNFGMVDIYEDEKMTKLLAKALHLSNIAVKTGDQVKYGQTIGTQDGIGRNGKREYAVHAHIELEAERFKEYIPDLIDGKFDFNGKGSTASVSHTKPNNNGNTKQIKRGGNDLTSQEYAKLTPQGKQLYDLRNNPNILAIADAVARSEGTDFRSNSKNFGYGMLIGNENISDFSGHPFVEGGRKYRHNSSASGRYQMMDFNYSKSRVQKQFGRGAKTDLEAVINYGGKDNPGTFSPGLQDLYFIQSLKSRGVLDQVLNGQITPSVLNKLAPHYASIQSGSRRSAYGGQGTPEGQHSNFLSFVNKRKSEAVDNPAMAAYTQGKVINPNAMQGLVTQGSNMQIQNLTQQKEIVGQTNDAEIANKRADFLRRNNQALRAFRRGLRDSQDNSLQSSRELEDTKNNIVENKSPGEQFQGKVNQMNRDFEDKIKARERKLIELEDQIKAARNLLGTGSLDTNQKVEVEKGLDQSLKEKSQYEAEVKKLIALKNTAFKESRTLFDKQESFRERQITFEETSQEINQMREKLEQLKAIQEPLAPQNKEILSLQKTISLKETQLDLDKQIAEIQQKILRKELTDEQGQKQIDNLKAVNEEKRKNIELSSRQAELEQNVKDIENRNTFEKTKTDFLTSRMFTKRDKQMDLMRSRGMNEFTINAFGRKNGKEQEEIRYQEELREFEAETARLKLQGIDIDPEALDRVRADMEAIHNLNLEGINNQFKTFGQTLDDIARNSVQGLSQGFTDLIMGTKSLNDVLDSFFDNILSQVLNTAFSSLLGGLTGGGMFGGTGGLLGGIFYAGGIVPNYANGGIHKALNKERSESGRKPMLVVAHEGEMMIPAWRMQELSQLGLGEKELLGYADGGVIGNMRSPAPNRANSGLEVKYDATVINNQSYVTAEQFEQGIKQAAQAGAEGGLQRMQNKLANSSSFRRSVGI